MFDVQYYVNEEKKVVIAKIVGVAFDVKCDLCKLGHPDIPTTIQDTFMGKAKCSPDDVFDIEKGKMIAFKRAYAKYSRAKSRELTNFKNWLENGHGKLIVSIDKLINKYDASESRRYAEIEMLTKSDVE